MQNEIELFSRWELMSKEDRRETLLDLEHIMKQQPQIALPHVGLFCNGVYAREITIPQGTVLVGEIHLHDQINVVSKGVIRVATEEGVRTVSAPCMFVSPAGTKRAGFALEDTVWTVFHATNHTDEDKVKADYIAPNYTELDKALENRHVVGSDSSNSDCRNATVYSKGS